MRRRELITVFRGMVVWPLPARAQRPAIPKVGYVSIGARGTEVGHAGLRQGLEDKGYVIGRDLALGERYADGGAERVPPLIVALLALNVDVLVTPGTQVSRAAQRLPRRCQ